MLIFLRQNVNIIQSRYGIKGASLNYVGGERRDVTGELKYRSRDMLNL